MKKLLLITLSLLVFTSCTNNYSTGNRVGIITKFSYKGLMWDSWEGDLKVSPGIANGNSQMIGQYEDFNFSIDNDKKIECKPFTSDSIILYMKLGIPVDVEYQQVKGFNWFHNRGCTDYFVKEVKRLK